MEKKRQRNPRIFVDTPPKLKRDYAAVCGRLGITVSADLRAHMRSAVSLLGGTDSPMSQEDASEEASA